MGKGERKKGEPRRAEKGERKREKVRNSWVIGRGWGGEGGRRREEWGRGGEK